MPRRNNMPTIQGFKMVKGKIDQATHDKLYATGALMRNLTEEELAKRKEEEEEVK
jgi:hypothetical protein